MYKSISAPPDRGVFVFGKCIVMSGKDKDEITGYSSNVDFAVDLLKAMIIQ